MFTEATLLPDVSCDITPEGIFIENKSHSIMRYMYKGYIQNLPKVSFSPESGGSVNPRRAMDEIKTHGTIRLKK